MWDQNVSLETRVCVWQMCVVSVMACDRRTDSVQEGRVDSTLVMPMSCEKTTEKHTNPSGNTSVTYTNGSGENQKLKLAFEV